jgi:hypothetical protein
VTRSAAVQLDRVPLAGHLGGGLLRAGFSGRTGTRQDCEHLATNGSMSGIPFRNNMEARVCVFNRALAPNDDADKGLASCTPGALCLAHGAPLRDTCGRELDPVLWVRSVLGPSVCRSLHRTGAAGSMCAGTVHNPRRCCM